MKRIPNLLLLTACLATAACGESSKQEETSTSVVNAQEASPAVDSTAENPDSTEPVEVERVAGSGVGEPRSFAKCQACHTVEDGVPHGVGPNLWGVFGKTAGAAADYSYSDSMVESGIIWDEAGLAAFLENPRQSIPGTKMSFPGLSKPEERQEIIEFLKASS